MNWPKFALFWQTNSNPVKDIINLIPREPTLINLELLDDIRSVMYKHCGYHPLFSNRYIMLLLLELDNKKIVALEPVKTTLGLMHLIARV